MILILACVLIMKLSEIDNSTPVNGVGIHQLIPTESTTVEKTVDEYEINLTSIKPNFATTQEQDDFINKTLRNEPYSSETQRTEFIKPEYDDKNRLACKIFPYDGKPIKSTNVPYLNGSLVKTTVSPHTFIATQAPKENTVSDHFQLMLDFDSNFLITLVMPKEPKKRPNIDEIEFLDRCVPYWEKKEDLKDGYQLLPGKTIQTISFEGTNQAITLRELKIQNKNGSESKTIYQYHYENWPDLGVPNLKVFKEFLNLVYQKMRKSPSQSPVFAHCHAGSGRTGIFVACCFLMDHILAELKAGKSLHEIKVNVAKLVFEMRLCRTMMHHTTQVHFIYEWLEDLVKDREWMPVTKNVVEPVAKRTRLHQGELPRVDYRIFYASRNRAGPSARIEPIN